MKKILTLIIVAIVVGRAVPAMAQPYAVYDSHVGTVYPSAGTIAAAVSTPYDGVFIQMDAGSSIILHFPTDAAVPDGTAAPDLRVDIFDAVAPGQAEVLVSADGLVWTSVGLHWDTANIDIDLDGIGLVRYVQVDQDGWPLGHTTHGFDLDGVEALTSWDLEPAIDKERTDGPEEIGIYKSTTTQYTFVIDYAGPAALVMDTVPAEFAVLNTVPEDGVDFFSANKANKSATIITWNAPAGLSSLEVTITTRESPGKGHGKKGITAFKPTSCGTLALNDGATAYEIDEFGEPVIVDGEMVILVGPSDPLEVEAVCGEKPCAPDGVTATLQLEEGDDDILVEWNTVCDVDIVYTVYCSFNSGPFTEIASLLNVSSHLDEDLDPGNYCYVVEAEYVAQVPHYESGLSDEACEDVPEPVI